MKITQLQDTKLINNMTPPRANPSVIMLDHGDSLDDYLFERGDLLDALSTKIYYDDVKTELATIYDVVTTKLRNHISDTCCHITAEERRRWNSCLSKEYVTGLIDAINQRLDGHEVILDQLQQEIADLPDFTQFVLRSELPDWSQFVTKAYLDEVLRNNVTTDNFMDELLAALGDIDPGDIDLHGYVKEGGYLGKINGVDFYQGDSIEIQGGGGSTGLPYKVTGLTYANNRLVLTQENNPNSPFEVEIAGGGGGGSSYVLPVASDSTLGGIKTGYVESQDHYAVQMAGDKAFVNVPLSSITPGTVTTSGYYETIYTSVIGDATPDTPANNITPASSYTSISGTYTWEHFAANSDGTNKVWMASRWNSSSTVGGSWSNAWLITGPEGEAGADGTVFEYIYVLTTQEGTWQHVGIQDPNSYYSTDPNSDFQQDDYCPNFGGWNDNAQGVDEVNRFEWVSIRQKVEGQWTRFSDPVIWSAYGRNGVDGDGVEYIYYVVQPGQQNPPAWAGNNNPPEWFNDQGYQTVREYRRSGSGWLDDYPTLTTQGQYVYMSMRKRFIDPVGSLTQQFGDQPYWHPYSTPKYWTNYPRDGRDGHDGGILTLEYPVLRLRGIWASEVPDPPYNNGGVEESDGIKYIDVVEYGGGFWKCVLAHNVPHMPDENSQFWKLFSAYGDAAFDSILANSAYIQSLSVEQLVVFDNNNQTCAGMSGNSATVGSSDIRIWAGATASSGSVVPGNLANAPFTVDRNGRLKATDAILSGQLTVGNSTIGQILLHEGYYIPVQQSPVEFPVLRVVDNNNDNIVSIGAPYNLGPWISYNFFGLYGDGELAGGTLYWEGPTNHQIAPGLLKIDMSKTQLKLNGSFYSISVDSNGFLKATAV